MKGLGWDSRGSATFQVLALPERIMDISIIRYYNLASASIQNNVFLYIRQGKASKKHPRQVVPQKNPIELGGKQDRAWRFWRGPRLFGCGDGN